MLNEDQQLIFETPRRFSREETSNVPVWATNLDGLYNANECSAIVSSAIDTNAIPGVGRLELTFEHAFETVSSTPGPGVAIATAENTTKSQ